MVAFDLLTKLLLKLDVLAPGMHLNIRGGWAINTWVGVFISLIYVGLTCYAIISQVMDYFDTTHPFIASEQKLNSVYPSIDIIANRHVPIVFALSQGYATLTFEEMQKYFTFKYRQYSYTYDENTAQVDLKIEELPTMKCRDLIESGKLNMKDYTNLAGYLELLPDHGACVDPTGYNLTIVGSNGDKYNKFAYLEIFPCILGDQCKPKEEINKVWLQIVKPAIGMDLANKSHPIRYEANMDDFYVLNTDSSQYYLQQLIMNKITDSHGFLIPDEDVVTYTTYDPPLFSNGWRDGTITTTQTDIEEGLVSAYFTFEWCSGMKFNHVKRTYGGFLDYLGTIGGINSITWILGFGLYYFWHFKQEKLAMVHSIYGLKPKKRNCCKKKKEDSTALDVVHTLQSPVKKSKLNRKADNIEKGSIFVTNEVIDQAFADIKASLDLVTICREINVIRYISSVILKEYQKGLIPLASLSKSIEDKQPSIDIKKSNQVISSSLFRAIATFASDLPSEEPENDLVKDITILFQKMKGARPQNQIEIPEEEVSFKLAKEPPLSSSSVLPHAQTFDSLELEFNRNFLASITKIAPILGIESMIEQKRRSSGTLGPQVPNDPGILNPHVIAKFDPNMHQNAMKTKALPLKQKKIKKIGKTEV